MAKSRRAVYCWTVTYSPGAAYCVATVIFFVQIFQPSTAVQFIYIYIYKIKQHTVAEPCHYAVTVLQYVHC
jgi:hypothetical protein